MPDNKIQLRFLTPNYQAVADVINDIHQSNYTNRAIKHIHKGKHARTENGLMIEVNSLIGPYGKWFDAQSKKNYNPNIRGGI